MPFFELYTLMEEIEDIYNSIEDVDNQARVIGNAQKRLKLICDDEDYKYVSMADFGRYKEIIENYNKTEYESYKDVLKSEVEQVLPSMRKLKQYLREEIEDLK